MWRKKPMKRFVRLGGGWFIALTRPNSPLSLPNFSREKPTVPDNKQQKSRPLPGALRKSPQKYHEAIISEPERNGRTKPEDISTTLGATTTLTEAPQSDGKNGRGKRGKRRSFSIRSRRNPHTRQRRRCSQPPPWGRRSSLSLSLSLFPDLLFRSQTPQKGKVGMSWKYLHGL